MSKWTHAICEACWKKRWPNSDPYRVVGAGSESCCFCGKPTAAGIYVREDPMLLNCEHADAG